MNDLHAQIMNIQCQKVPAFAFAGGDVGPEQLRAYKAGHRDARHAAAELALKAVAQPVQQTATPKLNVCATCAGTGEDFNEGDACHVCGGHVYLTNVQPVQPVSEIEALRQENDGLQAILTEVCAQINRVIGTESAKVLVAMIEEGVTALDSHAESAFLPNGRDLTLLRNEIKALRHELQVEHFDHAQTVDDAASIARENTELRKENDTLFTAINDWIFANGPDGWIETLRKDAERYRWLRTKTIGGAPQMVRVLLMFRGQYIHYQDSGLDIAIDAAMKPATKEG